MQRLRSLKEILIDFGLPALLIMVCFVLMLCRIDGEVKTILVLAAGWLFKSGYTTVKVKEDAL